MRGASSVIVMLVSLVSYDLIFSHYDSPKGNLAYVGGGFLVIILGSAVGKYLGGGWDE